MTLDEAFFLYLLPSVVSICAGLIGSLWITTSLWRTCRSLNLRIIDLEQAHVQVRNRSYANKRWANQEQLEAELAQLGATKPETKKQKYDNDPLDF